MVMLIADCEVNTGQLINMKDELYDVIQEVADAVKTTLPSN